MKRTMLASTLGAILAPAAAAHAQGAQPPPGQETVISVRVGSSSAEPCQIDSSRTLIAPGRPWEPGEPPESVEARVPVDLSRCKGRAPVVLRRARHMTVTLRAQSPQVAATWFAGGQSTPVDVRPVGQPPTAIWFLSLPLTSGKLVLHMWYPVRTSARGAVTQDRGDYKVAIRRKVPPAVAPPPTEPPPTTFTDSGR